jgi:DNA invertase Pin-like site-specific DNA recombinase
MIAAIYARKSTDQNVVDEAKSITRQVEHARAYATRKGWTVDDEHVYVDDGISGSEFVKRPGFLRLMNALKPRAPFRVLIMSEESRLGRESIETGWTLKKLIDAGVRVFYYLEDRERTLDGALDKMMMQLTSFASEMERERGRQRTRDAMVRKARRGHVAGGKVYGYRNVEVLAGGVRDHVRREIAPEEAAIIRRIYERAAAGHGYSRTAKALNADGVASPACGRGWATGGVREILFRELYRGRVVYGKTRWRTAAVPGSRSTFRRPSGSPLRRLGFASSPKRRGGRCTRASPRPVQSIARRAGARCGAVQKRSPAVTAPATC